MFLLKFIFITLPKILLWIFPGFFGILWNPFFKSNFKKNLKVPMYVYNMYTIQSGYEGTAKSYAASAKRQLIKTAKKAKVFNKYGANHPLVAFNNCVRASILSKTELKNAGIENVLYRAFYFLSRDKDLHHILSNEKVNVRYNGTVDLRREVIRYLHDNRMIKSFFENGKWAQCSTQNTDNCDPDDDPSSCSVPFILEGCNCRNCGAEHSWKNVKIINKLQDKAIYKVYKAEVKGIDL